MEFLSGQPLPGSSPPDAALKLTQPDADSVWRVSQAWKEIAEGHKSPNTSVTAALLFCQD